jgi:hypothetical protein
VTTRVTLCSVSAAHFETYEPVAYQCGHCDREVATSVLWRSGDTARMFQAATCPSCRGATLFTLGPRPGSGQSRPDGTSDYLRQVIDQQPKPKLHTYAPDVVPEAVGRRYVDAQKAIQATLWEQAIVTSRTAVQVMARLEDVKRGTLAKEIELLVEKRGSELSDLVRSLAHRIRDAGNDAAHPDDPNWAPTREEAEEALTFLQALIEWLYALPARLRVAEAAEVAAADGPSAAAEGGSTG